MTKETFEKFQAFGEKPIEGLYEDNTRVYSTLEELANGINSFGRKVLDSVQKDNAHWPATGYYITEELHDMLVDTPENQGNWDYMYENVPPYLLHRSVVGYKPKTNGDIITFILVYGYCFLG